MDHDVPHALREFTQRYVELWQQERGHAPASQDLYGVPSPCLVENRDDQALWLPQPFTPAATLEKVETALELRLQPDINLFYTQQYAGDMGAQFGEHHLNPAAGVERGRFYSPAGKPDRPSGDAKTAETVTDLFLATTESEMTLVSLCNVSGNVVLEQFGSNKRTLLAASLGNFLDALRPRIDV